MPNWSLVCFTLLTQSAIGLIWVGVFGRLFGGETPEAFPWAATAALAMTSLGLCGAMGHLAKPRLAVHAFGNTASSWLSREILLVLLFTGTTALSIGASLLSVQTGRYLLEGVACLAGAAALLAMIRVYSIKTAPVWNSAATPLEFTGSALLLGAAAGWTITNLQSANQPGLSNPALAAAGFGILLGLILKCTAVPFALTAEQASISQSWYVPARKAASFGGTTALRMALSLAGTGLLITALDADHAYWRSGAALVCFIVGEVLGRRRFYGAYMRIGL